MCLVKHIVKGLINKLPPPIHHLIAISIFAFYTLRSWNGDNLKDFMDGTDSAVVLDCSSLRN